MARDAYSVYVLRCSDGSLYTGIAADVERRLRQHRDGVGAKYTRGRGPLQLVFVKPAADRSAALRLEHRIRQLGKRSKEDLVAGKIELTEIA